MYPRCLKRLFDIVLAVAGLTFFALPMACFAFFIRKELGSPAFFRQKRVGRGGNLFVILKFRTLSDGVILSSLFCQWLRATALDELPQLINILRGEMSFVGPRPLIPEELADLDRIPGGKRRLSIRPGLAGLAQIYGSKTPALPQRTRWDLLYADRCSPLLDLWILLKSLTITSRASWDRPGPKAGSHGL